jgi:hypothetical protein
MKRFMAAIGLSSAILLAAPAVAQPESPAVLAKRQLNECMSKRMAADKALSYNDARRTCKERLQPPKELAANNPVETGTKSH